MQEVQISLYKSHMIALSGGMSLEPRRAIFRNLRDAHGLGSWIDLRLGVGVMAWHCTWVNARVWLARGGEESYQQNLATLRSC